MGRRLAGRLADMMSRRDVGIPEASGGLLTMIGGILLVLPGFLTDIAGLLLLIPAIQQRLIDAARSAGTGRPGRCWSSTPASGATCPTRISRTDRTSRVRRKNRPD